MIEHDYAQDDKGTRAHRGTIRDRHPEPMHLDRRIPIGLAAMIIGQIIVGVWWGAQQAFELKNDTHRLEVIEKFDDTMTQQADHIGERLARIEEKTQMEMEQLDRIESYVRKR